MLPNFHGSINGSHLLIPFDLEAEFGLVNDDICNGRLSHVLLLSASWILENGQYVTEISSLYICRTRTHPGRGVSGLPASNAEEEIISNHYMGVFITSS